ncbi:MAG: hypothetical protein VB049_10035 [Candidatus Pelethousia sp.]|nr:hypothetical protein [Candidatus Pelethousia sp.]
MNRKFGKKLFAFCLAAVLSVAPASLVFAQAGGQGLLSGADATATVQKKNEIVYATLEASGSVQAIYVVNQFNVTTAGTVVDHGNYASVTNLTNTALLSKQNGAVSFGADKGIFYYQGNMESTELPWLIDISYTLDGQEISPADLGGKSGRLAIHISIRKNPMVDELFFNHYMLQVSISLDSQASSDILAPDAMMAAAGKSTALNWMVMPKKEADLHLSATVRDFSMEGIQISGIPLSMHVDFAGADDMVGDFEKLTDAISDLNHGVGKLASGAEELKDGAGDLVSGSADLQDGLLQLSNNAGSLISGSRQIRDALSQISSSLAGSSTDPGLASLSQLPENLTLLKDGLSGISAGLTTLEQGFSDAYSALDMAIQAIPDTPVTPEEINALYSATDPSQHSLIDTLVSSYEAAQTVKGTYGAIKGGFDAVSSTIGTLTSSIDNIANSLGDISTGLSASMPTFMGQLTQLTDGLSQLSANYTKFHNGLVEYLSGVNQLGNGYSQFNDGLLQFADGVGDLYGGVSDLHGGTSELEEETTELPGDVQAKIDEMIAEYSGADFEPVSFISPQNTNINLVQFVLKCPAIDQPEVGADSPQAQEAETIWDRFLRLFKGD